MGGRTWNASCKHCTNSAPQTENSFPPHYSSSTIPCLHWARGTTSFTLHVCFQCVDWEDAHVLGQPCARSCYHMVKEAYPPGIPLLPVQLVLIVYRRHFYNPLVCVAVLLRLQANVCCSLVVKLPQYPLEFSQSSQDTTTPPGFHCEKRQCLRTSKGLQQFTKDRRELSPISRR
jgi:hypothetical protein